MEQNKQKKQNKIFIILSACIFLIYILILSLVLNLIPANTEPKKANNERATTTELQGATTLVDFNNWTKNNLGGVKVYSPSCIRIYSEGGSTWSYLYKVYTFSPNTYVNYNFHVTAENTNLRTGIRIYNSSTGVDYVNITETLSSPKTYQGTLKITSQETIRFDLRRNFFGTGYSGGCVWSGFISYSDYYNGYENGYDNGFDEGETSGRNQVINSPNDYNLYTQQQYNNNYTAGLESGYDQGFEEGQDDILWNPNDYNLYTQQQYNNNYDNGYSTGYDAGEQNGEQLGYENGYSTGFGEGKEEGLEQGYNSGHSQGYREGFEEGSYQGYDAGYDQGFEEGKEEGIETSNSFWNLLEKATESMHNFFSIEIIPGLTLATIIGVFVGLPLLIFFLKLISAK